MKFKFITTPKSLKKVTIYSRGMNDISNIVHSDKATECLNVNLKEMPAKVKNIPISLDMYLSDLDVFSFECGDNTKSFVASMYQPMLQCYACIANCRGIAVTETYDDFRMKYQSDIRIPNVIHPAGKDRKKWIDNCIDKAVTNSKASVLGDAIDIDTDKSGIIIRVHMQSSPFIKDGSCATQIGTFIKELLLLLEKDVTKNVVICCSKCFKELMRASTPIRYTRRFKSDFQIEDDLCEIKCCEDSKWIDIDQKLYPTIKYMNDNGLKTAFCCESHPFSDYDMYIAFDKKVFPPDELSRILMIMRAEYKDLMQQMDDAFEFELNNYPYSDSHCIRIKIGNYEDLAYKEGFETAKENMIQLLHQFCVELTKYINKEE